MSAMHPEEERVLRQPWYVAINDLIGGWIVANADRKYASELDKQNGEREVADCWSEAVAHAIADAHNVAIKFTAST